jgi:hypothetical protein
MKDENKEREKMTCDHKIDQNYLDDVSYALQTQQRPDTGLNRNQNQKRKKKITHTELQTPSEEDIIRETDMLRVDVCGCEEGSGGASRDGDGGHVQRKTASESDPPLATGGTY